MPDKGYSETAEPQAGSGTVLLAEQAGAGRLKKHHRPYGRTGRCEDLNLGERI
jgi:hypothetical protein